MSIISKLFGNTTKKKYTNLVSNPDYELSLSSQNCLTYNHYKSNEYENGYSSIKAIANAFIKVRPYAIDKTGRKIQDTNAVNKLYHPNQDMGSAEFREALAIMALVHPKVYILHWHEEDGVLVAGGQVTEENITGYTFLEDVVETRIDGVTYYSTGTKKYVKQDLIILKNINPYNLSKGFSPAQAARKWTTIDDYIAEYQAGFFENGAVPSGMFIITANTIRDFKDIKSSMQDKHRGAGKNGNVMYNYRPASTVDGKKMDAQIEWTPFNVQSKDMALKELFDQANQKIDSAYGVPASIRGVNSNNTYASVRVDEVIMAKYTVDPFLLKIWNRFTHELNRVTGGLGYAIDYDYEIPQVADEEKVVAETKQIESSIIINMTNAGFKLSTIVGAFKLPDTYLNLEKETKVEQIDNPDIDMGDEVDDSPEQPDKHDMKSIKSKQITSTDLNIYEDKVSTIVEKYTAKQVDGAIYGLDTQLKSKAFGDTSKDDDAEMAEEILVALLPLIKIYGDKQRNAGVAIILEAGLDATSVGNFTITETQKKAYLTYLKQVAGGYNDETAAKIREILGEGIVNGSTKQQIEQSLKTVLLGEENKYRVTRLSRTEVNLSEGRASVSAMENIQADTGYKVWKVWNTADGECEYCKALDGNRVLVSENFVDKGATVDGNDGGKYIADFKNTETADLHPNCKCYVTYEVE